MSKKDGFYPDWLNKEAAPKGSYREIFKWGSPTEFKVPKRSLFEIMKKMFQMTDDDFKEPKEIGYEKVDFDMPIKLTEKQIDSLKQIVGEKNVRADPYARLSVAYGKTMHDLMRLRKKIIENIPDVVLYPESKEQIEKIVKFVTEEKIPLYVYGGGSSVTRGVECMKGGISLDMRLNFNKVIKFNEINQTITVEAGMSGPDLEKHLNNATSEFGAKIKYTCGHFPQSFEYSSVGGWTVTRGAGQNSTYYGKIEDIVLGQEYATPIGNISTDGYPAKATGPDINQIMMGSEGTFGVLTHVTLRFFKYTADNRVKYSYIFKNWEDAQAAAREIMQGEFGMPSVFRVSDPEETELMLRLYGVDEIPLINPLFKKFGYKSFNIEDSMKGIESDGKCMFLGWSEGEKHFAKNQARQIHKICRSYKAMPLGKIPVDGWERGRFRDPYLRDSMQDFGIMTDTLECTVNWDNMQHVYETVRAYCKSRPNTVCTTHMSHAYPQGANLYFIFIAKMTEIEDYLSYHRGILDHIQESGAAISHHHGIGKMFAPWLEGFIGTKEMGIYKTLKNYFDKDYLLNPGGTIGLDLKEDEKVFKRPKH